MKIRVSYVRRCVVALAVLAATAGAETPSRIVAIGDVHGAFPEFVSILKQAGLVNGNLNWSGGQTTFVQLGDILDRGAESRKALDLMMKIETQAEQQHGKVIPLLGNHEVMDMMGDLRYVSAGEYQAFATDQSEKVREKEFKDYQKFEAGLGAGGGVSSVDRDQWMAKHPPGYFELRDAYGPKGEYGRWFRSHDVTAQIGGTIFLHGGLDPDLHYKNVAQVNSRAHAELKAYDTLWKNLCEAKIVWPYMTLEEAFERVRAAYQAGQADPSSVNPASESYIVSFLRGLQDWSIMASDGPLWYRGLATAPEAPLEGKLEKMMGKLNADHIVMGHTVMASHQITPRFGNRAFLIDTGMNADFFHGQPSALELANGSITAMYASGNQQVLVRPQDGQAVPAASTSSDGSHEP